MQDRLEVLDSEGVPAWLAEGVIDGVTLAEEVPDWLEVLVAEGVPVWLAERVRDGVPVRVMVGGTTHTLTASTSSIDGAWLSTALRTRNCSVCTPGCVMVCCRRCQGDATKSPSSPMEALNSVWTVLLGDASVALTTSASSLANSAASMPTQRTSYAMVVTSYAVTLSESVVYTPGAPAVSTAMCPVARGVIRASTAFNTDDWIVTRAGCEGTNGARVSVSKSLA